MSEVISIPDAVGAFVSEVRREHGLTLDQVAQSARAYGATWSASSVSNIERGQASMTLNTLLMLALALGDLLGRSLTLAELLGRAEELSLVAGAPTPVTRIWIDSVLAGAPVVLHPHPVPSGPGDSSEFDEALEDEVLRRMRQLRGRQQTHAERDAHLDQMLEQSQLPRERSSRAPMGREAISLAEERAAKKLRVEVDQLRQVATRLWGRSIEEESAARAGASSTPQARGRVTRVLVEEIRLAMGEGR